MRYIIIMLLLLSSCVATKQVETKNHTYSLRGKEVKSFKKSEKAYSINAQGSRVFSIYKFPTKDSTSIKIEYREGKTDTIVEVLTEYDTITNTEIKYIYKYINRVDTLVKDSLVTITDTREIDALKAENSNKDKLVIKAENRAEIWRKTAITSICLLIVCIVVLIVIIKGRIL